MGSSSYACMHNIIYHVSYDMHNIIYYVSEAGGAT